MKFLSGEHGLAGMINSKQARRDMNPKLIQIRTRKLGVLIRDARLYANKSVEDCAKAIGVSADIFQLYENGQNAPSLPEIEALAYYLDIPIEHFWGRDSRSESAGEDTSLKIQKLIQIRQKSISTALRIVRMQANLSLDEIAQRTGLSAEQLGQYESGAEVVPLPVLEVLAATYDKRLEEFYDQHGPIGQWRFQKKRIKEFLDLPNDVQDFSVKPVNKPFLQLVMRLSDLSVEKLRSVAESLLEITY